MKIKVAILEQDKPYLVKLRTALEERFSEKVEVYAFTDMDIAMEILEEARIHVFLAGENYHVDASSLPNRCAFAYLVGYAGIGSLRDQPAICKYQKVGMIYKQILGVYAKKAVDIKSLEMGMGRNQVVFFASACGGAGSTTMAVACAMRFAGKGRRVIYLGLEMLGSSEAFFNGDGQACLSDVIYELKSKKSNLTLALESLMEHDPSGVDYFSSSRIALDMLEMDSEDMKTLISEVKRTSQYDYIIVDMDFSLKQENLEVYRLADAFVWVSDGSALAHLKMERARVALNAMGHETYGNLVDGANLIYNKLGGNIEGYSNAPGMRVLGGAPRYDGMSPRHIAEELMNRKFFDDIE